MAVTRIIPLRVSRSAAAAVAALIAAALALAPDALARGPHARVSTWSGAAWLAWPAAASPTWPGARLAGGVRSQNDSEAQGHAFAALEACPSSSGEEAGGGNGQGAGAAGTATFSARMTQLPGTAQMQLRFEIFEREPGDASFHAAASVGGSAVGAWRISGEHVDVFKGFDEVTGLAGPAQFRARVRFRWLDAEGQAVDSAARHTEACREPALVMPSGS